MHTRMSWQKENNHDKNTINETMPQFMSIRMNNVDGQPNCDIAPMTISGGVHNPAAQLVMANGHNQQIYGIAGATTMEAAAIPQRYNTRSTANSYYVGQTMPQHLQNSHDYEISVRDYENQLRNDIPNWSGAQMEIPYDYDNARKQWSRQIRKVDEASIQQERNVGLKRHAESPTMVDDSCFPTSRKLRKVSLKASKPDNPEQDKQEFGLVPGRMSLLSSNKKYRVTVGEVKRRINAPECLNASLLGGILRRAKSKNGGNKLRKEITDLNVELPPGRRKAANVTLLTSMVEAEAIHMARDFQSTCEQDFPTEECAEYTLKQKCFNPTQKRNMVICAKSIALEFLELMTKAEADIYKRNYSSYKEQEPESFFNTFNYLTHGFGLPTMCSSIRSFICFCDEILNMIGNYG